MLGRQAQQENNQVGPVEVDEGQVDEEISSKELLR